MTADSLQVSLLALAWVAGWWLCARVRALPSATRRSGGLAMTAVIPARDEERTLPTLLAGLGRQTAPAVETIVVDDDSTDRTATVARDGGAHVIAAAPLPAGWTGKASALRQGVAAASTEVVVLLDADVDPGADLLARLAGTFADGEGLVSVQPYHRVSRWWEHASAFFNLVAVMGTGLASPRWPRRHEITSAFGPVMVCRRAPLLEHIAEPAVHRAVLDDVALALRFSAAGDRTRTFAGRGLVEYRMYDRPAALVEGWTKNFASGAAIVPTARLALIVGWMAACLASGAWVLGGSVVAIVAYAAFAAQCFVQLRQVGSFGIVTAALFPLLALVFVSVFAVSLVLAVRGEVRWKGRRVALRGDDDG